MHRFEKFLNEKKEMKAGETPSNDYEGEMATGELRNIISNAQEILKMLKSDSKLEAWVQSKITRANDYVNSVHDYMKHTPGSVEEQYLAEKKKTLLGLLGAAALAGGTTLAIQHTNAKKDPRQQMVDAAIQKRDAMIKRAGEIQSQQSQNMVDRLK